MNIFYTSARNYISIASRLFVAKIKSVVSVLFRLISESLSIGKQ